MHVLLASCGPPVRPFPAIIDFTRIIKPLSLQPEGGDLGREGEHGDIRGFSGIPWGSGDRRLSERHVAEARQQIRDLVGGEIKLVRTTEGYLEAEIAGNYAGLIKLAVGMKLKNMVAGEGFEPSTFGLCLPLQLALPG